MIYINCYFRPSQSININIIIRLLILKNAFENSLSTTKRQCINKI